jgi:hypothetical protein
MNMIGVLCMADYHTIEPVTSAHNNTEQYFTIILTNQFGQRKFGYCRRYRPPNKMLYPNLDSDNIEV